MSEESIRPNPFIDDHGARQFSAILSVQVVDLLDDLDIDLSGDNRMKLHHMLFESVRQFEKSRTGEIETLRRLAFERINLTPQPSMLFHKNAFALSFASDCPVCMKEENVALRATKITA